MYKYIIVNQSQFTQNHENNENLIYVFDTYIGTICADEQFEKLLNGTDWELFDNERISRDVWKSQDWVYIIYVYYMYININVNVCVYIYIYIHIYTYIYMYLYIYVYI
jgi:hypothetical protein